MVAWPLVDLTGNMTNKEEPLLDTPSGENRAILKTPKETQTGIVFEENPFIVLARNERPAPQKIRETQRTRSITPTQTSVLEKELDSLFAEDDTEVAPTSYAHLLARLNLVSAYNSIFVVSRTEGEARPSVYLPPPVVSTDDVGGIIVVWSHSDKSVIANFGARPERKSFVYSSYRGEREAIPMNELNLRNKLIWLITQ